ncbi:hypothetical protein [Chitinophaga ginsengisoli]|uniref:Uncharacterized protein n=1 Tax=Chitinophaga ginsengisoli TaxID=363837 RepID=A0A2P8FXH7_9BACT|nr:hypothetical protein [Chitinophaga ginsengisoli]PSL26365.1 hypothetical protein CLV42_11176 [Chitinophaga ginsengisoli]
MKTLFYAFAGISLVIAVISAFNLTYQLYSRAGVNYADIKGFEDINPNDDYNRVLAKFSQKIEKNNTDGEKDQNYYFLCSFLVTILTAGATLVSAIQAAKKENTTNPQRFAIILAVLVFCSTIVNFTSNHFNQLKTEAFKNVGDLKTRRTQFFAAYNKADANGKPGVIKEYETELDS